MTDPALFGDAYSDLYGGAGEPPLEDFTTRLYGRLPEVYRYLDETADGGPVPLRGYVSLLGDVANEVEVLFDRIDYRTLEEGGTASDASDLVKADRAEDAWLPWLAQLVGAYFEGTGDVAGRRAIVDAASSGWRAGTRDAIAAAAKSVLTGTQSLRVDTHYQGNPWYVRLVTRSSESPSSTVVLQAVVRRRAKPAGVRLFHTAYEATWTQILAIRSTWSGWNGAGTWARLMETGLPDQVNTGSAALHLTPSPATVT